MPNLSSPSDIIYLQAIFNKNGSFILSNSWLWVCLRINGNRRNFYVLLWEEWLLRDRMQELQSNCNLFGALLITHKILLITIVLGHLDFKMRDQNKAWISSKEPLAFFVSGAVVFQAGMERKAVVIKESDFILAYRTSFKLEVLLLLLINIPHWESALSINLGIQRRKAKFARLRLVEKALVWYMICCTHHDVRSHWHSSLVLELLELRMVFGWIPHLRNWYLILLKVWWLLNKVRLNLLLVVALLLLHRYLTQLVLLI